jgi:AcrR family transcriptional regulator
MDATPIPPLRARKKAQTRAAIQEQALRLFLAQGYEATTVEAIAAAAGVSHMTFFRYFPTKEDVVLADDYDALLVAAIRARPVAEAPLTKIRRALIPAFAAIYPIARDALLARTRLILTTPALRARLWEQQHVTEDLIAQAIADGPPNLSTRVSAAACMGALTTAIMIWIERDGEPHLPALIDQALTALQQELSGFHD